MRWEGLGAGFKHLTGPFVISWAQVPTVRALAGACFPVEAGRGVKGRARKRPDNPKRKGGTWLGKQQVSPSDLSPAPKGISVSGMGGHQGAVSLTWAERLGAGLRTPAWCLLVCLPRPLSSSTVTSCSPWPQAFCRPAARLAWEAQLQIWGPRKPGILA